MKVEFDIGHLISLLVFIIGSFGAIAMIALKQAERWLATRLGAIDEKMGDRFDTLSDRMDGFEQQTNRDREEWRQIERTFLEFKADLPMRYTQREDFIRGQVVIEHKLDAVMQRVEQLQIQGARNGN
ncbi:hypothetical protein [Lysobacter sp. CA196]|uniref:hypothetical protein n=1 Tax=Lysobacter sp. CA196 TaxID=3455606 RepID=UPI003F8D0C13